MCKLAFSVFMFLVMKEKFLSGNDARTGTAVLLLEIQSGPLQ